MRLEPEPLLEAVLAETLPPAFGDDLLTATLTEVRRRKRVRRRQRAVLAGLLGLGLPLAMWLHPPSQPPAPPAPVRSVTVVTSRPLRPEMIVQTRAGSVPVVESTPAGLGRVTSRGRERAFSEINDAELLALVAGRPVALVRDGGAARLVFADSANRNASRLQ